MSETRVRSTGNAISAEDPAFVAALARGLSVIQTFGAGREQQTLTEISRLTDLPRATVRRALLTLQSLGFIASDGKYFALTPAILSLGYAYLAATPLPRLVQPALESVSEKTHESASATILDGDEIVYIARAATKRIMSVGLSVGSRLPAFCTSMGRVLLAACPPEEARARLMTTNLRALTPHTQTSIDALLDILTCVRRDGYSFVDEELELGLRSLAVPVRNAQGSVVAAMNVSAQVGRVSTQTLLAEMLPVLRMASEALTPALGG
ncbi:MAG: IclR family transcriptional regulator C-terminal domain-containing protein [Beijerinckiaceae bacterium]